MSNRDVLEPLPNILTATILPYRRRCCQRQLTPANFLPDKRFPISPVVLEEDFRLREDAYLAFPPEVNDSTIREAIRRFQINIKNAIKHMDHFCCCCNRFVNLLELENIPDNDAVLMTTFKTYILHRCNLDVCGCCSGSFNFCHNY